MFPSPKGGQLSDNALNSVMKKMHDGEDKAGRDGHLDSDTKRRAVPHGVVSAPTFFPMAKGTGLMGEAGPEAIVPLRRGANGDLGVGAAPVHIHNYTGAGVSTEQRNGETHVIIGAAVQAAREDFARSMATGYGTWSRSLEAGYTGRRKFAGA